MNLLKFKHLSLRTKLLSYFIVMTVIFTLISGVSAYISSNQSKQVSGMVIDYVFLNDLNEGIMTLDNDVESYLINRSSEAMLNYYNTLNELTLKNKKLDKVRTYDESEGLIRSISFTLTEYIGQADKAIEAKRGRNTQTYTEAYGRMGQLSKYLTADLNELLAIKLKEGSKNYNLAMAKSEAITWFSFFLIASSLLVGVGLASYMTLAITKPLDTLTKRAERVSSGDFDVEVVAIETNDEIQILADAFNEMLKNIREHIDYLTLQSELENHLKEQMMQNLSMKSLLKEAELKSLQSQINPHFLYNTLNAASQLSMIEGADRTSEFIQKIAMYFRYMLKKLGTNVSIQDELDNVETYMYILKTRFGERISYKTHIEKHLLDYVIPSTILQPIVENAYIHGLEDKEENGLIDVSLREEGDKICIQIRDNGQGMDQSQLSSLLAFEKDDASHLGKNSGGIGVQNVAERLKIFGSAADYNEVIAITSELGEGTTVFLWLPKVKENA